MCDVICNEAVPFRPHCAGVATRTRNVSEYMLVLALCLVAVSKGMQAVKLCLKMICNDFLVVKVNCWSYVCNIIQSIRILRNIKDKKIAEKKRLKVRTNVLFTFRKL